MNLQVVTARLDGPPSNPRRSCQCSDIARHEPITDGVGKCAAKDDASMGSGTRRQASCEDPCSQLLHISRRQPWQWPASKGGGEVSAHNLLSLAPCRWTHALSLAENPAG